MNTTTSIRKKFDRALTLLLALAVIVGSVHWALGEADNELPDGVFAPELPLMQSDPDFNPDVDIYDNISYPEDRYTNLRVVDWAGFNINELGEYELTYALDRMPAAQPEQPDGTQTPDTENSGAGSGDHTNTEKPDAGSGDHANTENSGAGGDGTTESTAPDKGENSGAADTESSGGTAEAQSENSVSKDSEDGSDAAAEIEAQADDSDSAIESRAAADTPAASTAVKSEANPAGKTERNADENTANKTEAGANENTANKSETTTDAPSTGAGSAAGENVYFKRTVIVMDPADMEGVMTLAEGDDVINNNYPWGTDMGMGEVTLHVPRAGYTGKVTLKMSQGNGNLQDWDEAKANDPTSNYLTVTTRNGVLPVTGGTVTLSSASLGSDNKAILRDGAWYRFEYEDLTMSRPVRLVKSSNTGMYSGDKVIPVAVSDASTGHHNNNLKWEGYWYISNDVMMYRVGAHNYRPKQNESYDFNVLGRITSQQAGTGYVWAGTANYSFWTVGGQNVERANLPKPTVEDGENCMATPEYGKSPIQPTLTSFRISFQKPGSNTLRFELAPDTRKSKHISIATEVEFGNNAHVSSATSNTVERTINRRNTKIRLVSNRSLELAAKDNSPTFVLDFDPDATYLHGSAARAALPEYTCIGHVDGINDETGDNDPGAGFLWAQGAKNVSTGSRRGISVSWLDLDQKADPTIRFTFSIDTYKKLDTIEKDNVTFFSSDGVNDFAVFPAGTKY